ncbi:hypothetical protein ERJ75_000763700 [Trypanosoma vivax]|uniref:Uncharacterized protein n=1 Tax=Trypanosoma vivax (strain Y486) TaxID=1055687 RepID=G0TVA6_TRYVY|nr:hypothetical protein TRVL_08845 [Trypanosoma vivax]KAH8613556.1 hypothetical protein ERJ75_000763700 [Trypanosoma vivax]CCC47872.1 conserved hypothetical protein [Trypanosoma vivax Y486]
MEDDVTFVAGGNVRPDDEEEEITARLPSSLASQLPHAGVGVIMTNGGDNSTAVHDDSSDDEMIKYVSRSVASSVAPYVTSAHSSVVMKRPRCDDVAMEHVALDLGALDAQIPDDTDHPQDHKEFERWKARDAARSKKLLEMLLPSFT